MLECFREGLVWGSESAGGSRTLVLGYFSPTRLVSRTKWIWFRRKWLCFTSLPNILQNYKLWEIIARYTGTSPYVTLNLKDMNIRNLLLKNKKNICNLNEIAIKFAGFFSSFFSLQLKKYLLTLYNIWEMTLLTFYKREIVFR